MIAVAFVVGVTVLVAIALRGEDEWERDFVVMGTFALALVVVVVAAAALAWIGPFAERDRTGTPIVQMGSDSGTRGFLSVSPSQEVVWMERRSNDAHVLQSQKAEDVRVYESDDEPRVDRVREVLDVPRWVLPFRWRSSVRSYELHVPEGSIEERFAIQAADDG